jgi:hypothetical protein
MQLLELKDQLYEFEIGATLTHGEIARQYLASYKAFRLPINRPPSLSKLRITLDLFN